MTANLIRRCRHDSHQTRTQQPTTKTIIKWAERICVWRVRTRAIRLLSLKYCRLSGFVGNESPLAIDAVSFWLRRLRRRYETVNKGFQAAQLISLISHSTRNILCERRYGFIIWSIKPTKVGKIVAIGASADESPFIWAGASVAIWVNAACCKTTKTTSTAPIQQSTHTWRIAVWRLKTSDALIFREICISIFFLFVWRAARDSRHHDASSVWTCLVFYFYLFLDYDVFLLSSRCCLFVWITVIDCGRSCARKCQK